MHSLKTAFQDLEAQHAKLKQEYFDEAMECKRLQQDFDLQKEIADQHVKESNELDNMQKLVDDLREERQQNHTQIEELRTTLFQRERDLDKCRHQLKYGVVTGGISKSFNHNYSGHGGTISQGDLRSKIEIATEDQALLSQTYANHFKWRELC